MSEPNPEDSFNICDKRRAILEGDGHMLVIGGPGAGKTTIALLKARRHVLESLTAEQSVLFLSFSNSAIRRILESAGGILTSDIAKRVDTLRCPHRVDTGCQVGQVGKTVACFNEVRLTALIRQVVVPTVSLARQGAAHAEYKLRVVSIEDTGSRS